MIVGQDEGSYVLRLSQSVLFKRLTGYVWYYRADDSDMIMVVETNRSTPIGTQRVVSFDKLKPQPLNEFEIYDLFKRRLNQTELAHSAYWNSRLWC